MGDSIAALISRMETDLVELRATHDARRFFHAVYLRTTRAVADEIAGGGFTDAPWLERWDLAFADLYRHALAADRRGEPVAGPWRVAFDAARDRHDLPPLHHVLLGMNAHINYDLPQALIAMISTREFDDPHLLNSRAADHRHVDEVLLARVAAEDDEMSAGSNPSLLDRVLRPANRVATRRILTEARRKVWQNTAVLDHARRQGPDRYTDVLGQLETLCAERLTDLTRPGPVLLRFARRGFGVVLPTPLSDPWRGPG
jgi:hypothetical protein